MSGQTTKPAKCFDILEAKKALKEGDNITELLRHQKSSAVNTSEIIEISYDIQAGNYIRFAEENLAYFAGYAEKLANIIQDHLTPGKTLLDIGTGEATTLSFVAQRLTPAPLHIFAFDISWSRIYKGVAYAGVNMGECFYRFTPFVGDISEIPIRDKSVDVTISNHALEPNGGRLPELLSEIFRVTRDKALFFEPCYEINSDEGKKRMDELGFIKGLDAEIEALGGRLVEKIEFENVYNPLNPTVCFVVEPPAVPAAILPATSRLDIFAVPGTNHPLEKMDDFFFSNVTGQSFPILKSIPILKSNSAILSTALSVD